MNSGRIGAGGSKNGRRCALTVKRLPRRILRQRLAGRGGVHERMARTRRIDAKPIHVLLVLTLVLAGCITRVQQTPDDSFQLERNTEFDGAHLRMFVTLDDGTEISVNWA